jgi:hypothetical protein
VRGPGTSSRRSSRRRRVQVFAGRPQLQPERHAISQPTPTFVGGQLNERDGLCAVITSTIDDIRKKQQHTKQEKWIYKTETDIAPPHLNPQHLATKNNENLSYFSLSIKFYLANRSRLFNSKCRFVFPRTTFPRL